MHFVIIIIISCDGLSCLLHDSSGSEIVLCNCISFMGKSAILTNSKDRHSHTVLRSKCEQKPHLKSCLYFCFQISLQYCNGSHPSSDHTFFFILVFCILPKQINIFFLRSERQRLYALINVTMLHLLVSYQKLYN